ncbi:DUF3857 domain-containing protein, partial [Myxococcota bacterium]|nr:DUF3857 domain-containing protein [Myxococcota bacterium]
MTRRCLLFFCGVLGVVVAGSALAAPRTVPDSRIFLQRHELKYKAQKVSERYYRSAVYQTRLAFDTWLDPRVRWDKAFQKLTLLSAHTRSGKGGKLVVPPEAINTVTPFHMDRIPLGTTLRETVYSFIGAKKGTRSELSWRRDDVGTRPWPFEASFPLLMARPVTKLEFSIGMGLRAGVVHPLKKCRSTRLPAGGLSIQCDSMPGLGLGDLMQRRGGPINSVNRLLPRLVVSSFPGFKELGKALTSRQYLLTSKTVGMIPASQREKIVNALSADETIRACLSLVHESIRTLAVPRVPVALEYLLKYRAGTALERALFLSALLNYHVKNGRARVVHLSADGDIAPDVPALIQFPIPLVLWDNGSRTVAIDAGGKLIYAWPSAFAGSWYFDPASPAAPKK